MTETTQQAKSIKKGFGKDVIMALGVLVLLFAISTIYFYNQMNTLQSQLNTLEYHHLNYALDHIYNNTQYWEQVDTAQFYMDWASNHSYSNAEYYSLNGRLNFLDTAFQNYVLTHNYTNNQYNTLFDQVNFLNTAYQNYVSTHNYSNTQYNTLIDQVNFLDTAYQNYVSTHNHTNSEYDSLQSQVNSLKAPKLISVNLKGDDIRTLKKSYLHVYGYICNVGTNIAYNSRIHVILYQSGGVVAEDTYVTLGTINGESWISVDSNVNYSGTALTGYRLTLEWTS